MKKAMAMVLVMVLMTALAAGSAYAENYVFIKGDANVRQGPGLDYTMVAQLNAGSTVTYLQQASYDNRGVLWYRVAVGNGGSGWVSSIYSALSNVSGSASYAAGANTTSNSVSIGYVCGRVCVSGDANLRVGPSLCYSALDTMYAGETAGYLGCTSYDERGVLWYNVQYDGMCGWVSSAYAYLNNYVQGTSGKSNVRTGPDLDCKSLGTLHKGETATFLGNSAVDERGVIWYNICFNGASAWVSSRYTTLY